MQKLCVYERILLLCAHVYVCVSLCVYVSACICECVCVCVCVCVSMYLVKVEGGTIESAAVFSCQDEVGEEGRFVTLSYEPT